MSLYCPSIVEGDVCSNNAQEKNEGNVAAQMWGSTCTRIVLALLAKPVMDIGLTDLRRMVDV